MKKNLLKVFIVILFLSLFTLLNWNSFSAPFERDEGEYAYSAWILRSGDLPYQNSFLQKPPLIIYTYLFGQLFNPWSVVPPRVLASIFILLTAFIIYIIAKKEWGKIAGVFSVFLFLPMIGFPPLTPFAANTEKFMILPMVGLLALFVYFKESQKTWPYILAGILGSLAVFYKPICLFVVLTIIIFWLFELYKSTKERKIFTILKKILIIGLSSLFTSFILLIPFLKILPNLFQEVFTFNISYINSFGNPFANFSNYLGKFFSYWWILLFLPLGLFFKKPKNFLYYVTLLIISLFTIFSTPIGHYYLMIMPFLALLCGSLYDSLFNKLSERQKNINTIIILPIVLYIMLFPFSNQFSLKPQDLSVWVYGTVNPFGESKVVADNLAKITKPNDLVFIAGSEPQIYYYSKRKSSTRFIITYPLNLPTVYREQFQLELISDIEKNKPKAIIISQREMSGLWNEGSPRIFIDYFNKLISEDYNIIGGYVWGNDGLGYWQEPIEESMVPMASFLLLNKNN